MVISLQMDTDSWTGINWDEPIIFPRMTALNVDTDVVNEWSLPSLVGLTCRNYPSPSFSRRNGARLKYLHLSTGMWVPSSLQGLLDASPQLEHLVVTGFTVEQWSGYRHPCLKCLEMLLDHTDFITVLKTGLEGFPALREVWAYGSDFHVILMNLPTLSQPGKTFEVLKEGTSYPALQSDFNAVSLSLPGETLGRSDYLGVLVRIFTLKLVHIYNKPRSLWKWSSCLTSMVAPIGSKKLMMKTIAILPVKVLVVKTIPGLISRRIVPVPMHLTICKEW